MSPLPIFLFKPICLLITLVSRHKKTLKERTFSRSFGMRQRENNESKCFFYYSKIRRTFNTRCGWEFVIETRGGRSQVCHTAVRNGNCSCLKLELCACVRVWGWACMCVSGCVCVCVRMSGCGCVRARECTRSLAIPSSLNNGPSSWFMKWPGVTQALFSVTHWFELL